MQIIKRDNDGKKVVYTPFRSVFDDFFMSPFDDFFTMTPSTSKNLWADMYEEDGNYVVKMALPGIKEDDVKISLEDGVLKIVASSKSEEKEEGKKRYLYKSMESSYEQRFNLPGKVDADKAEAKLEDGVITVKLPKTEEEKARQIKISK
ncbi:MAG: Heat shock protein, Hsp20 family [candidate division WS6 bacterium GW2011_GWF2_39_15]|uniref:Heat shock protein, Hsp20 family n=1 Tax=candidate division WS6 bacterium GW2011_GWF2_39_15 TaxID=1619100 RepID=A0A0G0QVX9_9BACT|nr:MAG: Heat shock protein, Hsp20 family [candidate division WS6 bacterium GW2011_GWF2_39_15]